MLRPIKEFGLPNGKIKVFFSIKAGAQYAPLMVCRCHDEKDAARLLWSFRKARREVKNLHSSRYLNGFGFKPYSLRWLACHNCELFVVDGDDVGKSYKFTAPYLEYITAWNESR